MKMMRHCRQCRADAVGLLGEDRSQEFSKEKFMEMTPEYNLEQRQEVHQGIEKNIQELEAAKKGLETFDLELTGEKMLLAVATKGGGIVNQHFGHAKEFQIYEVDGKNVQFIGHRKVDHFCQDGYGEEATLENIIKTLADCRAVLVSKIGDCPKDELQKAGIKAVEAYDIIDKVALEFYKETINNSDDNSSDN
jgi:nitrogen fixation protein NifB